MDGNKRLAWHATAVFLWLNGYDVTATDDELFELGVSVADGSLTDVKKIEELLEAFSRTR